MRKVSSSNGRLTLAIMLLGLSLALVITDQLGFLRPVEQITSTILSPLARACSQFGKNVSRLGEFLSDNELLRAENLRLRTELAAAQEAQGKVAELANKVDQLEKQLQFKSNPETSKYTVVSADVVNRDSGGVNRSILINKGANQGIAKGMPVVDISGYLVGRVATVNSGESYVLLISDSNLGVNVYTQRYGADGKRITITPIVDGIAHGQYQLDKSSQLKLSRIQANGDIQVQDWIYTSGLGNAFPQNILVGRVEKVINRDGQPEKEAYIRPIAELDYLQQVSVITAWGQKQ